MTAPPLFQSGTFRAHSGATLAWKIECDALTDADWKALAEIAGPLLSFSHVEGVPSGGLKFAEALRPYAYGSGLLIADDVLTTGGSMEAHRAGRAAIGLVAFSRTLKMPEWVRAIWIPGIAAPAPNPEKDGR